MGPTGPDTSGDAAPIGPRNRPHWTRWCQQQKGVIRTRRQMQELKEENLRGGTGHMVYTLHGQMGQLA